MNGSRLAFQSVLAIAVSLSGSQQVLAQYYYGGTGYGPRHQSGYYASGYVPGGYTVDSYYGSPLRIAPGYANTYGLSTGYYGTGSLGYGTSYGLTGNTAILGAPNPVYSTSTTIIRGGPTGGVVNYTNNGNGYTYVPDSTYTTLIQQQPTLGLSRVIVPPNPPPVVIESRPPGSTSNYGVSSSTLPQQLSSASNRPAGTIKLVCPKTAGGTLSYALNGHPFTIEPGFSQTIRDDRAWTLEFKRGAEGSEVARYSLRAGTYAFAVGVSGWELQSQQGNAPASGLPPAPLPAPTTSPLPMPSPPPTPQPPP